MNNAWYRIFPHVFLSRACSIQVTTFSLFRSMFTISSHVSRCLPALLVPKGGFFMKRFRVILPSFILTMHPSHRKRFLFISPIESGFQYIIVVISPSKNTNFIFRSENSTQNFHFGVGWHLSLTLPMTHYHTTGQVWWVSCIWSIWFYVICFSFSDVSKGQRGIYWLQICVS